MFNGNIARMVTTITNPNTRAVLPLGNAYRYDQLNRLTDAISFTNLTLSTNTWGSAGTGIYQNNFTYDANGNILTQVRKNESGATIDDLQYKYQKNSAGKTIRNRLYHVDDATSSGTYTDDIDDMGTYVDGATINSGNNYIYDAEGRLIKDVQEQIASIVWRVDGKVKEISRTGGSSKKNLKFDYDAMGHRIAKHQYTSTNVLEKSTYYILDAQGNTIATYEREIDLGSGIIKFAQKEKYINGRRRLGVHNDNIELYGSQNATYSQSIWNHIVGKRTYELSEHRNNVLSVISDKPIPHVNGSTHDYFLADIRQSSDYSAFGVQLSGRNFLKTGVSSDYSMGFQGQLEDDEIKGEGNSVNYNFRIHDPRLGRFFVIDPLTGSFPWNSPYAFSENIVINAIELEGLEQYSLSSFSFAPFTDFGGGFHGDGKDRKFNDVIDFPVSGNRSSNFRIGCNITVDMTPNADKIQTDQVIAAYGAWSYNSWAGETVNSDGACYSAAYCEEINSKSDFAVASDAIMSWSGYFHNYGGNCDAPAPEGAVPNIDVYMDLALGLTYGATPDDNNVLTVRGSLTGDHFPANEIYIRDEKGTKVMLGVSGCDGYGKATGPYTELATNVLTEEQMAQFEIQINLNSDGSFKNVVFGNKTYSCTEWNNKFEKLTPAESTCTTVNSSGTFDSTTK